MTIIMAAVVPGKEKLFRTGLLLVLLGGLAVPAWAAAVPSGGGALPAKSKVSGTTEEASPEEAVLETKGRNSRSKWDFDGSFRYLYGQGHMEGQVRRKIGGRTYTMPFKELMIMQTLRTRLYLNYHFAPHWKLITGVEDNRVLNDQSLTDTAHIHRFFAEGEYPKAKYRAGRFSYKVNDGNVLDATLDGIRLGWGPETERATVF